MLRVSVVVLSLLAVLPVARGETYHVAQGDAAASDKNPGTLALPCGMISKAATALEAGDTVVIHHGVYREYVKPGRGGTAEQPISYVAAPGERVVITGADVLSGWVLDKGNVWKVTSWTHRFPTHPNDEFHRLIGRCEQVIVDGKVLKQVALPGQLQPGCFCAMPAEQTLYVQLTDGGDPREHLVEASVRPLCFGVGWGGEPRDHIQLRGLTFRYAANMAQRGALSAVGNHWLIEDCDALWTNGTGITFRGDDITLRHLKSHHHGQQGAGGSGRHFLLNDVSLSFNNVKGFDSDWEAGAIKITHARDGTIRNCRAEANRGNGLWFDIDVRNVTVDHCAAIENDGHGIFVEISGGFDIRNNVCARNGRDGKWGRGGISVGESDHCTIERNVCVMNPTGVSIRELGPRECRGTDGGRVSYHVHDINVIHNVCALNSKYQIGVWWDNAFFGPHPSPGADEGREEYDPGAQSLHFDENSYWLEGKQKLALWGVPWRKAHQEYADLQSWQQQQQQDLHSRLVKPQFVDAEHNDWRMRSDDSSQ